MQLILSLFSGIGLLDRAFKEAGFCVVSAGDLITGQDIRDFTGTKGKFDGVIGGSPCQDFSKLKRVKTDYSLEMIEEYTRIVTECDPTWWLLENVAGVPDVKIDGYGWQRLDINQAWYENVSRLRHIQFGHEDNITLNIPRGKMNEPCHGCALASDDRSFKELVKLQGLEEDYDLSDFTVRGKKKAVGNGVPLSIGRVLANEVKLVTDPGNIVTDRSQKKCECGCGRDVPARKKTYDATCRKRLQRNREKQLQLSHNKTLPGGSQ